MAVAASASFAQSAPDDTISCNNDTGDKAIAACTRVLGLNPQPWAFNNRGNAYYTKGDLDRAIADYNEAIRLDPKDDNAFYDRGTVYNSKGNYDHAVADLNEALRLNPKNALAFNNRGSVYYREADYDRAIADYSEAIRLNPNDAVAFNNRGLAYGWKGDDEQAIADYSEAIRLNPNDADALANRGYAYDNKGDYDHAIADLTEVIRLNPNDAEALANRGYAYAGKGDYDQAIADYTQAIRLNSNYADAFADRGNAYLQKGDYDHAIADLSEAIQLDPNDADARQSLEQARAAKLPGDSASPQVSSGQATTTPASVSSTAAGPALAAPAASGNTLNAPSGVQRAILYEEDKNNPTGYAHVGSVVWRSERLPTAAGQSPDLAIRADIEIPEQKMRIRWSLRRNDDKALPASHAIEIMVTLAPDSPHGAISNIPGLLMKQGETTRGVPLAGLAVKVNPSFFLIGLSSVDTDMRRNMQLLKERARFDIPIVYADGKRAILAIEKGLSGERSFADAFAAWDSKISTPAAPALVAPAPSRGAK